MRCSRSLPTSCVLRVASLEGSALYTEDHFQHLVVQHGLRQQPLESIV